MEELLEQQESRPASSSTQSPRDNLDDLEALPINNNRYSKEKVREWVTLRKQRNLMRRKLLEISREKNASNAPIHVLGSDPRATYIAHHLSHKPGSNPVCLILPTKGTQKRWEAEGSRITLVRGGKLEYSNEIFTEFLNISTVLMEGIRDADAADPRVHTRIYHLVVTLPCRNTVRALSRLAHRIGPWTTVCLIQNGMGTAELLNRTVFRGNNRAPAYVMGHMSHDLGYDANMFFTVRELKPGLLRLASYIPYGTHFDRQSPDKEEVDPTPKWGEHDHRLQRRVWKPDQRKIAWGPDDWRHRKTYQRLGTSRVSETTRPHYIGEDKKDDKSGASASDGLDIVDVEENGEDHGEGLFKEEDKPGRGDREFAPNVSMSQRKAIASKAEADEAIGAHTQTAEDKVHQPVVVYSAGQTRRPTRPTTRTLRAYELGRRRRWMLSQDVRNINASKILGHGQPRYLLIYMLATTPKLFAGRYSLYSVYRRKLPEMIYTAAFEPVATVMQLPISRATWAQPVVRTMIMGIIDELISAATWIPELLKSYKLRHDIRSGMLRRRVLNEFFARTRKDTDYSLLQMGYEGLDGGYQNRALGFRRRGGVPHPIGGLSNAAHCVMEQLVASGMTTDIQYLNGYFVRRGMQSGIAMPQNQMIIRMLEARMMVNRDQSNKFVPIVGNTYLNSGDSPEGRRPGKQQLEAPKHQWRSAKGLFNQSKSKQKKNTMSGPTIIDPETSDYGEFDLIDLLPEQPSTVSAQDEARSERPKRKNKNKGKPRAPKWDSMSPLAGDQTLRRYYQDKNQAEVDPEDVPSAGTAGAVTDSLYSQDQLKELRHLGYVRRDNYVLQRDRPLGKEVASEITLRLQNVDDMDEEDLQNLDRLLEDEMHSVNTSPRKTKLTKLSDQDPDEPSMSIYDEDAAIATYYFDDSQLGRPVGSEQPRDSGVRDIVDKIRLDTEARQQARAARLRSLKSNFLTSPETAKGYSNSDTKM